MTSDELKKCTITFRGDKFMQKEGDRFLGAGTCKLDPTKRPRAVDFTTTGDRGDRLTSLGIYDLKGDTLRACFDARGKERPTEFKTQANSGRVLFVIRRQESK